MSSLLRSISGSAALAALSASAFATSPEPVFGAFAGHHNVLKGECYDERADKNIEVPSAIYFSVELMQKHFPDSDVKSREFHEVNWSEEGRYSFAHVSDENGVATYVSNSLTYSYKLEVSRQPDGRIAFNEYTRDDSLFYANWTRCRLTLE